eukprot:2173526-Amphidinium_carterae.1
MATLSLPHMVQRHGAKLHSLQAASKHLSRHISHLMSVRLRIITTLSTCARGSSQLVPTVSWHLLPCIMTAGCKNEALFSKMLASPQVQALWESQVPTPSGRRPFGSEPLGNSFLNFLDEFDCIQVGGQRSRSTPSRVMSGARKNTQPCTSRKVAQQSQEPPDELPASQTVQVVRGKSEPFMGKLTKTEIHERSITTLMVHGLPRWLTQWHL